MLIPHLSVACCVSRSFLPSFLPVTSHFNIIDQFICSYPNSITFRGILSKILFPLVAASICDPLPPPEACLFTHHSTPYIQFLFCCPGRSKLSKRRHLTGCSSRYCWRRQSHCGRTKWLTLCMPMGNTFVSPPVRLSVSVVSSIEPRIHHPIHCLSTRSSDIFALP